VVRKLVPIRLEGLGAELDGFFDSKGLRDRRRRCQVLNAALFGLTVSELPRPR